jgi:hypothetical protein
MSSTTPARSGRAAPRSRPSGIDCRRTDIQTVVEEVANRVVPFLADTIAVDPARASRATRVTAMDLKIEQARRARCRYWVAVPYARQFYPQLYAHPGPFETEERVAQMATFFTQLYDRRGCNG